MSDEIKAEYTNNGNYDPADHNDDSDEMPTTGAILCFLYDYHYSDIINNM